MKYEFELKRVKRTELKEVRKSIYKNPVGIFTLIITVIIVLYIVVNLPKHQSIKAIKTSVDSIEESW